MSLSHYLKKKLEYNADKNEDVFREEGETRDL